VLHCHLDYWPFSVFSRQDTPFLTTLHGRLDLPELRPVYECFPNVPLVSISDAQRLPLPDSNFIATVQHGLPADLLRPRNVTPSYLAFLGRICPEKRPDRAIRIARAAGIPLKIAAKVDRVDEAYFRDTIRPMIDGRNVELIGEISDAEKPDFLSGAIALLVPIDWPEPFGLVMIEAMACGTPVIAFNRGSVPEIIEHGITGMIVEDEVEAVAAIRQVAALPRAEVRRCFERRFSAERMAEDYLALYRRLAARVRPALRVVR
jgi:glycosyltransferase involved in cell wall biosynthesis